MKSYRLIVLARMACAGLCLRLLLDAFVPVEASEMRTERYLRYRVQQGDHIGKILAAIGLCPLWGDGRNVARTVDLNKDRLRKGGDLINVGEEIFLPVTELPAAAHYQVSETGDLSFSGPVRWNLSGSHCKFPQESSKTAVPTVDQPVDHPKEPELPEVPVAIAVQDVPVFARHGFLKVQPKASYLRIDGTQPDSGSRATLLSNASYGIDVSWVQVLSESVRSFQTLGVANVSFSKPSSTPLENSSQTYSHLGLGIQWNPYSFLWMGAAFELSQELLYRALPGKPGIMLETMTVKRLGLIGNVPAIQLGLVTLDLGLNYYAIVPFSSDAYKSGRGASYGATMELSRDLESVRLTCGISYQQIQMNTSVLDLLKSEVSFALGGNWRLGR